jgi:hypothetical protein
MNAFAIILVAPFFAFFVVLGFLYVRGYVRARRHLDVLLRNAGMKRRWYESERALRARYAAHVSSFKVPGGKALAYEPSLVVRVKRGERDE